MIRCVSHKVIRAIYEDAFSRYLCLCCGETYDPNIFNDDRPTCCGELTTTVANGGTLVNDGKLIDMAPTGLMKGKVCSADNE